MADQFTKVNIFIGSPSGLEEERKAARRIVDEINKSHGLHWNCFLELVGWEETLPGHGRPQSLINRDLDRCDYFIGVIHKHWGSKTATGSSKYTSGFHEEYERSLERTKDGKMKDMVVYFKTIDSELIKDPGASLQKVIDFRTDCFEKKEAMYAEFGNLTEFEALIRIKLEGIGWEVAKSLQNNTIVSVKGINSGYSEVRKDSSKTEPKLFDSHSGEFLEEILTHASDWSQTTKFHVARFRLIATGLSTSHNDDVILGSHDANLLFLKRMDYIFSTQEFRNLLKAGLKVFFQRNAPIWCYVQKTLVNKQYSQIVARFSVFGEQNVSLAAIKILEYTSQSIPSFDTSFTQDEVLKLWFSDTADNEVFHAAIKFVSSIGEIKHLVVLEQIVAEMSTKRSSKIQQVIASIKVRQGEIHALNYIVESNIPEIDSVLCDRLFVKPASFTSEQLSVYLNSSVAGIRKRAAQELFERQILNKAQIEILISDSDYSNRLIAVEALARLSEKLDDKLALKVLTKVKSNKLALSVSESNTKYYDIYKFNQLVQLGYDELYSLVNTDNMFIVDELKALYKTYPRKFHTELKQNIADGFVHFFDKKFQRFEKKHNDTEFAEKVNKLIPFLRGELLVSAVESLCSLKAQSDLQLVRNAIDNYDIRISTSILNYMSKFGDWDDIGRVLILKNHSISGASLISMIGIDEPQLRASTLISLAANRISDLLNEKIDVRIKRFILLRLASKHIQGMTDEYLIEGFDKEDGGLRNVLALRCCVLLSKKRLNILLDKYHNKGTHYYSIIHILDMAVSLPRATATTIAKKQLAEYS